MSHECDFPTEVAEKPRVTLANVCAESSSREIDDQVKKSLAEGAPLYAVDWPTLASLRPDLIVTQAQCDVCAVSHDDVMATVNTHEAFKDVGVIALNPVTLEDVLADIQRLGVATFATAANYLSSLRARIDKIRSVTDGLAEDQRPRVVCIEWIEPLMVAANWMPGLVEMAGGRHGLTKEGRHSTYTSWQQVVDYDPEVIVAMPCGFGLERTIAESRVLPGLENWEQLTAVKSNRVFAVDGNALFNRSGPRIVDSLEVLGHLVQPEFFSSSLISSSNSEYYCQLTTVGGKIRRRTT